MSGAPGHHSGHHLLPPGIAMGSGSFVGAPWVELQAGGGMAWQPRSGQSTPGQMMNSSMDISWNHLDGLSGAQLAMKGLGLDDTSGVVGELDFPRRAAQGNHRMPAYRNKSTAGWGAQLGAPVGPPFLPGLAALSRTGGIANSAPANVQPNLQPAFQQPQAPMMPPGGGAHHGLEFFSSGSNVQYPSMALLPLALQQALQQAPTQAYGGFGHVPMQQQGMGQPEIPSGASRRSYDSASSLPSTSADRNSFDRPGRSSFSYDRPERTSFGYDRPERFERSERTSFGVEGRPERTSFGVEGRPDRSSLDRPRSSGGPDNSNSPRGQEYRQLWDQVRYAASIDHRSQAVCGNPAVCVGAAVQLLADASECASRLRWR